MVTLRAGEAEATILPERGAAFTRLAWRGRDLLAPDRDNFLMAPWTNRLDGGRIFVDGTEHRMPINRPQEDTAIHGFLRDMPWRVTQVAHDRLMLDCDFDRAPFTGTARLRARLAPDHLALEIRLANAGAVPTPMGLGWHPYVPRPPGTRLRAQARIAFGRDARNLPIAPAPSDGLDGADAVLDGLDAHFAGWDGVARIDWPDGLGLTLRAAGAWAANLQVFAPASGNVLAVEPVSHAPDAANRPEAAAHGPMHVVRPGGALDASLVLAWAWPTGT